MTTPTAPAAVADVLTRRYLRSLDRAENAEPLPDVPVGTIPDDLAAFWPAPDAAELQAVLKWSASLRHADEEVTPEAEARFLHRLRLRRAVDAKAKADRSAALQEAFDAASRCAICAEPTVRTRITSREPLRLMPEPEHTYKASPKSPPVACCSACRPVVEAARVQQLSEAAAGNSHQTRGELARQFLAQHAPVQ